MNREQIKKWLPEMTAYSEGKDILYMSNNLQWEEIEYPNFNADIIYVINDKHVEARKAFALGEPIEVSYDDGKTWYQKWKPNWNNGLISRPKKKEWFDNIPEEGVLCWVFDNTNEDMKVATIIMSKAKYFNDLRDNEWKNAEPVKTEECYDEK